ncbi:MAG: hypothetical protein LBI33_12090 [Propionibacteriaceae bacterium]|jgi:hypothetical protein|nr:hypothetical protein [Propionibacteriaceae bacterium]
MINFSVSRRRRRLVVLLVGVGLLVGATGCTVPDEAPETYGGLPTWLPTPTITPGRVLAGSQATPALTTQGLGVLASLPDGGTVLITVAGPLVPGVGLPDPPEWTVCTFTVTLTGGTVPVGISVDHFRTRDMVGHVYQLALVADTPPPPDQLAVGATVSFDLRANMKTGEGLLQWAPDGANPVASWSFVVEND